MRKIKTSLAVLAIVAASTPAFAQSTTSSGHAASVDQTVRIGNIVTGSVHVGPLGATAGGAPNDYNVSNSVVSLVQNTTLVGTPVIGVQQRLSTGLLQSNAQGSATAAQASASVDGASFSLVATSLFAAPVTLLSLSSGTIQSYAQANSVGGLDASGSSLIQGLRLSGTLLGNLSIDGSLFASAAPNTVLLSLAGLTIKLNEQTRFGDGITGTGIATNAIHVAFNNFLTGTGLLNGDIVIGHSQAFATAAPMAAVPEPASWAMMLIGFGAVGHTLRRARPARGRVVSA